MLNLAPFFWFSTFLATLNLSTWPPAVESISGAQQGRSLLSASSLSPCSVCRCFLLIVADATLVLAVEWQSNVVVVAEVQASVTFDTTWDVARCFSLDGTIVSRSLRRR
jgi:hypothetical protein